VKSPKIYYRVTEDNVKEHAPVVHNMIQDYYKKIARVGGYISDNVFSENVISDTRDAMGVNVEGVKYNPDLLKNDEFRMAVIYHYSLSQGAKVILPWGDFLLIKASLENEMETVRYEALSLDTNLLKTFNVDPSIIPPGVMGTIMRQDEYNKASNLITTEVKKLKSIRDGFQNYTEYFEYMLEQAQRIERKCHQNEFYGTHDIDRFACVCISVRMKMPYFDDIYKVSDIPEEVKITTENAKNIQKQIAEQILGMQ